MKPLMLRLTDEERAELERRRAAGGHRSLNETVKAWLAPPEPFTMVFVPGLKEAPKVAESVRVGPKPRPAGLKAIIPGSRKVKQTFSSGKRFKGVDPVTNEEIWS